MSLVPSAADLPLPVDADGWVTDGLGAVTQGPPGMLLHPGGPSLSLPRPDLEPGPELALELDASHLLRLLARPSRRPTRWAAPAFGREVELVRSHLRPIRTQASLAGSFGREAFHGQATPGTDRALGASAVRVAYALRWLELTDGLERGSWRTLLDGEAAR